MKVLVIAGPTAVGKTAVALAVAPLLRGEIISADSRQIYRGMDIGTAKPGHGELTRIRHHMIDVLEPHEKMTAGRFGKESFRIAREIESRGNVPMVVGGAGLYIQSFLTGFTTKDASCDERTARNPPAASDPTATLEEPAASDEPSFRKPGRKSRTLHEDLLKVDPESALRLSPGDTYRIERALEYYHRTGGKISDDRPGLHMLKERVDALKIFLHRDREELYRRIDGRVDEMITRGLFDEVRSLLDGGCTPRMQTMRTVGYAEVCRCLGGELDRGHAVELIKKNTRNYAKRQLTWFRRLPQWRWISMSDRTSSETAERIVSMWREWF